jgi:putative flavoprotein involved in K+ transport
MSSTDTRPTSSANEYGDRIPTVVVGAGQTGLSTTYHLTRTGHRCVVLDENERVGDHWRRRYDSLRLNTPARWDGLPGQRFDAPGLSFPSGADMGDHLERYAESHGLDIRHGVSVSRIDRLDDGGYRVTSDDGVLLADHVVVATGGEHHPKVPDLAGRLDPGIRQLHSSDYHNPDQLLPGPVLVVGISQSGADLALEVAQAGHQTYVSGKVKAEIPVDIPSVKAAIGAPVLWFVANHVLTLRTKAGRRMQQEVRAGGAPLVRVKRRHLEAAGVQMYDARTIDEIDGKPVLEDGTVLDVANVLWCTGFRQDFSLIHPSVTGEDGWPRDEGGVVPEAPGLYFVGLLSSAASTRC